MSGAAVTSVAAAGVLGQAAPAFAASTSGVGSFRSYPFSLGIASGDPLPDSVILWTRLAPEPLAVGSGMPQRKVPVHWQVADDEAFKHIVTEGEIFALPENNHSVHVDVRGLRPDRWYFYRFRCGSELSPVGRTRTLPALGATVSSFNFAHVSCQNWINGHYTAYRDLARENLDVVFHLGDYIYETQIPVTTPRGIDVAAEVRAPCHSVDEYRLRYALYKLDANLQASHAAFPWVVTWDDHEVANDYAGAADRGKLELERRAAGYKAWWENIPTRMAPPVGPDMKVYRRFAVGNLVQFDVLDGRQYRKGNNDPVVSKIGDEQEAWLIDGIGSYDTTWNVMAVGQQLGGVAQNSPTRNRIYQAYYDRGVSPVILAGDLHWTLVSDALLRIPDASSPIVGSQFIGTSITSTGDGPGDPATVTGWMKNPWVKYAQGYRGYFRHTVTPTGMTSTQHNVQFVTRPDAPGWDAQSCYIDASRPGVQLL
ncbi:alkaline phosphatase D family protein [Streptomyces sp. NPDC057565]|uniref:alkaline phosphatase D family protein n=1 Tax=Streptomyces sp. NPDC057565 TaxID=3346169 RepID=UPI0036A78277